MDASGGSIIKRLPTNLDRFYEVNLPALLQAGNVDEFIYFYAFFRRQAFEPGNLGIEELRQESVSYARGMGESLKAQIYEALRHIAQGFLDYPANHLRPNPETLNLGYGTAADASEGAIGCYCTRRKNIPHALQILDLC